MRRASALLNISGLEVRLMRVTDVKVVIQGEAIQLDFIEKLKGGKRRVATVKGKLNAPLQLEADVDAAMAQLHGSPVITTEVN